MQPECSYFLLESDTCSLFKFATIEVNNDTNAGICPKYDQTKPWESNSKLYYPPKNHTPDMQSWPWCGEAGEGSICTFPFSISTSDLHYIPYKDRCGTDDNQFVPMNYSVNNLTTAGPCKGK